MVGFKEKTETGFVAATGNPVFFRTYSRRDTGTYETKEQAWKRSLEGLRKLGKLTDEEFALISEMQFSMKSWPSGRWMWVGGTAWSEQPKNFPGCYNCSSTNIDSWEAFGLMMALAMMGCGTGAVLEHKYIDQLPEICNQLDVEIVDMPGAIPADDRCDETTCFHADDYYWIVVGDSREGWVDAYTELLYLASDQDVHTDKPLKVKVALGNVRPEGEKLKGFGGVANPIRLPEMFPRCASVLNKAVGRQLNSLECCLLIDEAAACVVAGNVRRSAGMRQFDCDDVLGATAKDNLWQQDAEGNWKIDPERDVLRMANHTRVFHRKPTKVECIEAVRKQFYSGEGAIQWAGEAKTRSGGKYGLNPCGEILLENNFCVAGDTWIITRDGLSRIQDLVGTSVEVWNGKRWSLVTPVKTGEGKKLYRVSMNDGSYIDATEYHKWYVKDRFGSQYKQVQTKDLMTTSRYSIHTEPFVIEHTDGMQVPSQHAYTLGFAVGDGTVNRAQKPHQGGTPVIRLYGDKMNLPISGRRRSVGKQGDILCQDVADLDFAAELLIRLKSDASSLASLASWSRQSILHFIAGLADADGSSVSTGGIRIYISDWNRAHIVQLLLTKCGIRSSANLAHEAGQESNFGARKTALYYLQITDCQEIPCHRLDTSRGHQAKAKGKWQVVKTVEELPGLYDTYCFEEFEFNKAVFNNSLTGNCNLSEIHLNLIDPLDFEEQRKAFTAGAINVAALLNHEFTIPRYQKSREEDPIVGVSFTGLFDFFVKAFGADWLHWWAMGRPKTLGGFEFLKLEQEYLSRWKKIVHQVVWEYCDRHGLRRPNRCTTVQPAGCLTKDYLRVFDQGLLYADEHMDEAQGEVDLSLFNLTVRDGVPVRKGIANDLIPLIKITMGNGRTLKMTPNHRLSVNGEWVFAEEMIPGMKIDFKIGGYTSTNEAKLLHVSNTYSGVGRPANGCKTPEHMSPSLGYFLGALFGNGCVSENKYRVRFCHENMDVLHRLNQISEELFGVSGAISIDIRGGRSELTIANKHLYYWLLANGLSKSLKSSALDRIPIKIRSSSRETILAFLAGLIDTDGCIRESGSLSIDSASEEFVRHIQQIGEAVGLCFSFYTNFKGENFQKDKRMFGLCLSRMLSLPEAIDSINKLSIKAATRSIPLPKRYFSFNPYEVTKVEWIEPEFTYDYGVEGVDDDDSWYWQGAIKSHNTKSLLTGASAGWAPPKSQRFIRRITFSKNDPVAKTCLDYGYSVVPSQSDKDENGVLLNDPFDPRCTEWLVEIPVEVSWANLPGADQVEISQFSALAQFDFYMQVQKHYTAHNTSATIEVREHEVEDLGSRIYQAIQDDEGYISAALLARFDDTQTFPRLPFEPISKAQYDQLVQDVLERRTTDDFHAALAKHDNGDLIEAGPAGCDSDKCMLPERKG